MIVALFKPTEFGGSNLALHNTFLAEGSPSASLTEYSTLRRKIHICRNFNGTELLDEDRGLPIASMPKQVKRIKKNAPPPDGYNKIESAITRYLDKLRNAQLESSRGGANKKSSLWPIYQINHQLSRYVYEMYFKRALISRDLYEWLLLQKYVNADLIAKWKKQGYEKLCCVSCIMVSDKNQKTTCICRVPRATLVSSKSFKAIGDSTHPHNEAEGYPESQVECMTCGCKGCASTD